MPSETTWVRTLAIVLLVVALLPARPVVASISPEELQRLGGAELTPVGAERGPNAAGTIPPWDGGITGPIPGYSPGDHHPDPFVDDKVLFTITAANRHEYDEHLSAGQKALLDQYPESWRMPVYPSRRSAAYPDFVYEALLRNATESELIATGRGGVSNARVTSPFPIPREGVEVVLNHNLRWRGIHISRFNGEAAVTRRGNYTVSLLEEEFTFPYAQPGESELKTLSPYLLGAVKQKVLAPTFMAGSARLVIESINYNEMQRLAWRYNPDLRRVIRIPFAGQDNPEPGTDALRFNDEVDMYNGSPMAFSWKLLGKREMYIPYNAYRLHSDALEYDEIVQQHHINPEHTRYELHRVWVVEGTVRVKKRNPNALRLENRGHVYARRVFYVDEDSWQIAMAENYDESGQLWRFSEGHMINFYEVPVPWYTLEVYHDLKARRYLVYGLNNQRRAPVFDDYVNPMLFGPNALDFYVR